MQKKSISAYSRTRFSRIQHFVASVLLIMVVAFLVINPLWECHDNLDNLRHLGPHGILVVFLLFACAGITLFRSLCWFRLTGVPIRLQCPKLFGLPWAYELVTPLFVVPTDSVLPLRI